MYRLSIILVLKLLAVASIFAQPQHVDRAFEPEKIRNEAIRLGKPAEALKLNVSGIEVVDYRLDTLAVGVLRRGIFSTNRLLHLKKGELASYLNQAIAFDSLSPNQILMVVRDIWMVEEPVDQEEDKFFDEDDFLYGKSKGIFKIDFFLRRQERLYAMHRLDTVLEVHLPLKDFASDYIVKAIIASLSVLQRLDYEAISKKKKFTLNDIASGYSNASRFEIFQDTGLVKGVYKNFQEFTQNNPSIREYQIRRGRFTDVIYLKSRDSDWIPTREVWGYSDGKKAYIKSGENYYQLIRYQNSFYILGSKMLHRTTGPMYPLISTPRPGSTDDTYLKHRLRVFKLNIESGKLY